MWIMPLKHIARNILDGYNDVKIVCEYNPDRISELVTEINDIQHILGLNSHDAVALVKLAKELKKVLQERWELKDELELAKPLYDLFSKHEEFFKELQKAMCDVNKIIDVQENRRFTPRIRNDLCPSLIKQENNIVKLKTVMEMRNAR